MVHKKKASSCHHHEGETSSLSQGKLSSINITHPETKTGQFCGELELFGRFKQFINAHIKGFRQSGQCRIARLDFIPSRLDIRYSLNLNTYQACQLVLGHIFGLAQLTYSHFLHSPSWEKHLSLIIAQKLGKINTSLPLLLYNFYGKIMQATIIESEAVA